MVLMSEFAQYVLSMVLLIFTIVRVDKSLNCIKGGGACQLQEKVLAEAAKTSVLLLPAWMIGQTFSLSFIVVADFRKNVEYLGTSVRSNGFPIHNLLANVS